MADDNQFAALIRELRILAAQARQRGDLKRTNDLPPAYWYGVQFGYEDAIERLEALLKDEMHEAYLLTPSAT